MTSLRAVHEMTLFNGVYANRSVLITGHTGFKGSWLALVLDRLGARASGMALAPKATPNHFDLVPTNSLSSEFADIRNLDAVCAHVDVHQPEIVIHLAAQASVMHSYADPIETFSTNAIGTANILEAARRTPSVRAVVVVTTDKCYENREWPWGYRETDTLGGYDPYSASKACAELVASSFRNSFARDDRAKQLLIATARGGNAIGGGDWTPDRLVPDAMQAAAQGAGVRVRNPLSTRPWQHVLDLCAGYLLLGQRLLEGDARAADAWNFGPDWESNLPVTVLIEKFNRVWPAVSAQVMPHDTDPHETQQLMLDSTKAKQQLQWAPVWNVDESVIYTAQWYRAWYERGSVMSAEQVDMYVRDAVERRISWAVG